MSHEWLARLNFLKGASRLFMVDLSLRLHSMVFVPGDIPPSGYLYIVASGIALYRARIVTRGGVWAKTPSS